MRSLTACALSTGFFLAPLQCSVFARELNDFNLHLGHFLSLCIHPSLHLGHFLSLCIHSSVQALNFFSLLLNPVVLCLDSFFLSPDGSFLVLSQQKKFSAGTHCLVHVERHVESRTEKNEGCLRLNCFRSHELKNNHWGLALFLHWGKNNGQSHRERSSQRAGKVKRRSREEQEKEQRRVEKERRRSRGGAEKSRGGAEKVKRRSREGVETEQRRSRGETKEDKKRTWRRGPIP